ncbi:MAG: MAPEG family protein [Lentisphaeraceae bacterium]|nr:MAPEG family protein [Lentisphaeraceae bacterium]
MTIAYWCLLVVMFTTYVFTGIAKFWNKGYNNGCPRAYLESLNGPAKRAYWAHLNSFEVMPQFAVALIIAHQLKMPQQNIDTAAILFAVSRIFYGFFYIKDMPWRRSWTWVFGMLCVAYLIAGKAIHG